MKKSLEFKALRVLREGIDADMISSGLHFDRLCALTKMALDAEESNHRVALLICYAWIFSNTYDIHNIDVIEDAIADSDIDDSEDTFAIIDVMSLAEAKKAKGMKYIGRISDGSFRWAFIQLWRNDEATFVSAEV